MKRLTALLLFAWATTLSANPLLGLPALEIPANNPQTPEKIALGKKLFNDVRFSSTGTISCASCHHSNNAFTDGQAKAIGIEGLVGKRNSPTLVNAAYLSSLFHDGRAASLEEQALEPLTNPVEHGLSDHAEILNVIRSDIDYLNGFLTTYGITVGKINIDHVTKAISSFERSLIAGNSRFDQYLFGSKRNALSVSEARGLRIFRRKANCANCHEISWDNALFTDNRFYNIGVSFDSLRAVLPEFLAQLEKSRTDAVASLNEQQKSELGRFAVTQQLKDIGVYKTPTLRNIALTAPYMHDGSFKTLREVVDYYDKGGKKNKFLNPAIFPLHLTEQEKDDLVAFMESLTSPEL
ncbi:MAG: cytochrome-c peroxidase [Cycloclasticus sp. symbiont of Poecilosclerida sp. M]|nr:MAG: cytochrome-c peroxidase [Cycloclasticus sp. symbiont of Poecilosclerida sp. M]